MQTLLVSDHSKHTQILSIKDLMKLNLLNIKVYFINLPEHEHRELSLLERMKSAGFSEQKIERVEAIRKEGIPEDSVYVGCFHSQLKALKLAALGEFPFIILEDDANINYLPAYIDLPDNTDSLYVGISAWGFSPESNGTLSKLNGLITDRIDTNIIKIFNMLSSHAILYTNKNYVENLISDLELNLSGLQHKSKNSSIPLKYYGGNLLPCDVIMADNHYNNNVYALRKPIFYQDDKHKYCTLFNL